MKAKTILISSLILLVFSANSCFDHGKLSSGNQNIAIVDESPMTEMLQGIFKDVNDSVQLAFRGKKLFTSKLIKNLYSENKNLPIWTSGMKPNQNALEMIALFSKAHYYGLDTSYYQLSELQVLLATLKNQNSAEINKKALEFELLMTHNTYKFMSHLKYGLLQGDTAIYGFQPAKYPANFPDKLQKILASGQLTNQMLDLQPKSYEYKRLLKGLEIFLNSTALSEDSFQMPDPAVDSVLAYRKAREILIAGNYLKTNVIENNPNQFTFDFGAIAKHGPNANFENGRYSFSTMHDTLFFNALKEFQKEHGLNPDGKIGLNTMKSLKTNNRERFEQIAVNLERLKWEKNRPEKYVYVNIPAYKLRVFENHNIVKTFNVVVGAKSTETPLLNSRIEYFIANPEWNVPFSISSNELLPKIKNDSTYLARHNYRIFDKDRNPVKTINWSEIDRSNFSYSIQQGAGSGNALGKIKFIFPNPYNVYIHDTQDKSKFTKDIRAYSHGCMRVQDPNEFAKTLLKLEPNNMADSVDNWLSRSERKKIDMPEPIPVFVRYVSCEADANGKITFYQDIYGKDKEIRDKLFAQKDF